tara:strand:- start:4947 stop:5429 length:483 start_codon:yes stop_codon:yes gene_type:complete
MFSSKHEIWKFACAGDELDDWLPYAEDLVNTWGNIGIDEVRFENSFQIVLASLLLMDDLLPRPAKRAFAKLALDVIDEANKKKVTLTTMKMSPAEPGRKADRRAQAIRLFTVKDYLKSGLSKQEAYQKAAVEFHKSPDTIRREFERAMKKSKQNRKGEIN